MWKSIRKIFINQLGFTKSESNGFIVLIFLTLAVAVIPPIYLKSYVNRQSVENDQQLVEEWRKQLSASISKKEKKQKSLNFTKKTVKPPESFVFNPNSVSSEELNRLGFSRTVSSRIVRYREAGGSFECKEDLRKIYGINSERISELNEYIDLPEKVFEEQITGEKSDIQKIDINQCLAEDLQLIPGIGPTLSGRIIKYRELLGGYSEHTQLHEVYGLSDSTIHHASQYFVYSDSSIVKLDLNSDDIEDHPYINYKLSKTISNYQIERYGINF
jgi:DNA uptake protein ComE-like DNA-binding protein